MKMMEEITNEAIYLKAIDKYGRKEQMEMLNEEATELALATRKYLRLETFTRLYEITE